MFDQLRPRTLPMLLERSNIQAQRNTEGACRFIVFDLQRSSTGSCLPVNVTETIAWLIIPHADDARRVFEQTLRHTPVAEWIAHGESKLGQWLYFWVNDQAIS